AGAAALAGDLALRLAEGHGGRTREPLALGPAGAGLPRRRRGMARPAGGRAAGLERSGAAGLRPPPAVPADGRALCRLLASREAGLVLPRGDRDDVAAAGPAAAVADRRLVAATAWTRA